MVKISLFGTLLLFFLGTSAFAHECPTNPEYGPEYGKGHPQKCRRRCLDYSGYCCPQEKNCIICKVVHKPYVFSGWECHHTCSCYEETRCELGRLKTRRRYVNIPSWRLRKMERTYRTFNYYPCHNTLPLRCNQEVEYVPCCCDPCECCDSCN